MILILHVTIALSSVLYATYALFRPAKRALVVNYALVGATFASGTYLVVSLHSPLLGACASGLAYLGAVSALLLGANLRLAAIRSSTREV